MNLAAHAPSRISRIITLAVLVLLLMVAADAFGLYDWFTQEQVHGVVRDAAERSGWLGILMLLALFTFGIMIQIPGVLFIGAAVMAYGGWNGGILSFGAGLFAVTVSFVLVRAIGGKAEISEVRSPTMSRMLTRIGSRPVWVVIVLRSIFWLSPPLNYALALSPIRFKHYVIGSALGLVGPVASWALFFDQAL